MRLKNWAKQQGITYKTAYRWFKAGIIPHPTRQMPTGAILIDVEPIEGPRNKTAIYARVSSSDQQADLDRQVSRIMEYATQNKLNVVDVIKEIGSGLNGHRSKLLKLLANRSVDAILVEHRDRLARFGADYLEAALASSDRKLLVVDETEMKDDLVQDMLDVLTSFCARLYGRRSAKNKAKKAVAATHD